MTVYEVMGFRTFEGSGVNTDPAQGKAIKPNLEPIYRTDDFDEVNAICLAGGYTDSANVWWVAEGWREAEVDQTVSSQSPVATATDIPSSRRSLQHASLETQAPATTDPPRVGVDVPPIPSPPRKGQVVPDNSSATVDADGRVRTDPQKQPLTEDDVARIAESEAGIPRKRNILP